MGAFSTIIISIFRLLSETKEKEVNLTLFESEASDLLAYYSSAHLETPEIVSPALERPQVSACKVAYSHAEHVHTLKESSALKFLLSLLPHK